MTRLLLADEHKLLREGLRSLLDSRTGLEVVGEAETGKQAVLLALELEPDVVVMGVEMSDISGIEATRRIREELPGVKVLALSRHATRRYINQMLHAGANGYVVKSGSFDELTQAIHTVMENATYLSPSIEAMVVQDYMDRVAPQRASKQARLTPREREVLQLLADGKATREIATALGVSVKTVESHRMQIKEKLGLRTVAELTKYALREGLTTLES